MAKSKNTLPAKPQKDDGLTRDDREFMNSLSSLASNIMSNGLYSGSMQLSQTDSFYINNRWYLISNNRQLLSQMYVEHGIVQTLIDQPVDDAFRSGFEIKSSQLDGNDVEELMSDMEDQDDIANLTQSIKWGRLFGGGGTLIITDQDPATPLDLNAIDEGSPLYFKDVDMWELYSDRTNIQGGMTPEQMTPADEYFHYYGKRVHWSRLLKVTGKKAPSFVRPRLRGWGMSEVEKLVRSLNQYLKNQDVVYELLDEAKIDVYKMENYNSSLLTPGGTQAVQNRIHIANALKNFQSAITMDKDDEYEQKQISFAGLPDMLLQIRQGIAADLKMPMTKIFGISAAGFNSGEDDIENYNSMLDGEIRAKNKRNLVRVIKIRMKQKFGFIPDDLKVTWNPLRILSAEQEENVKEKQFNRVQAAASSGFIGAKEYKEAVNKGGLLPIELAENDEVFDPPQTGGEDYTVSEGKDK